MLQAPDLVQIPSTEHATGAIIFLHGLGDSADGWAPAFPLRDLPHVRTVLPSAPSQPVSLNMGFRSPSWFDLKGLDESAPDDEPGIMESVARVDRIIDALITEGIPSNRIVVAGFSQGGAVALTMALQSRRPLAAVVGLSTWLPLRTKYPANLSDACRHMQIFMGHGTADQVVSFKFGEKSAQAIQTLQRRVTFKPYLGLTHSSSPGELEEVRQFISTVLPQH